MRVSLASCTFANLRYRVRNEDCALGVHEYGGRVRFVCPQVLGGDAPVVPIARADSSDGQSVVVRQAGLLVVDGMSGERRGDLAAFEAVRGYRDASYALPCAGAAFHAVAFANMIKRFGNAFNGVSPAAAVVMALVGERGLSVASAGDARAYLARPRTRETFLLTRDHSRVRQRLESLMDIRDAKGYDVLDCGGGPMYQYLSKGVDLDFLDHRMFEFSGDLVRGDVVALLSDGAYECFRQERGPLGELLSMRRSAKKLARDVVMYASAAGSTDNCTAAVLKIH